MIKNACVTLLCSRGTPMFLAGDEFCNTQFGNNNPYCQDNEISWLDWSLLEKNREIFEFFKYMIQLRKSHEIIRHKCASCSIGFPDISYHGVTPWIEEFSYIDKYIGIMFAGKRIDQPEDDIIYLAINAYWEGLEITLPELPMGMSWYIVCNTYLEEQKKVRVGKTILAGERSVLVLIAQSNTSMQENIKSETL